MYIRLTIGTTSIGLARWVAERSPDREARCAVDLRRSGKRIQRRAEEVRAIQLGAIVGHRPRLALGVLSSDHAGRSADVPCSRRGKWATHRFGEEATKRWDVADDLIDLGLPPTDDGSIQRIGGGPARARF